MNSLDRVQKDLNTYLDKTESYSAHLSQLIHRLKAMIHRLAQQLRKLLVVEYLQTAAGRDFADGGRVEVVVVVALATLYEDAAVTETLGEYLAANVVQVNTFKQATL